MKRARAAVTEQRNLCISKDNQVLLSKLIEIQNGKTGTFSAELSKSAVGSARLKSGTKT